MSPAGGLGLTGNVLGLAGLGSQLAGADPRVSSGLNLAGLATNIAKPIASGQLSALLNSPTIANLPASAALPQGAAQAATQLGEAGAVGALPAVAGSLPSEAVTAATALGEPGAVGAQLAGTGAGSAGAGLGALGTGLGVAGAGADLALNILSNRPDWQKGLNAAVDVAAAAAIPATGGLSLLAIPVLNLIESLFGGSPELTHAQREAQEIGTRISPETGSFGEQIGKATNMTDLFNTLLRWQSGYVGGTSPRAILTNFDVPSRLYNLLTPPSPTAPRRTSYPGLPIKFPFEFPSGSTRVGVGLENQFYPVIGTPENLTALLQDPAVRQSLQASVQAGVTPGLLDPFNKSIQRVLAAQLGSLPVQTRSVAGGVS